MQLESIRISGFRSLENQVEVPVKSPTLLVGHNDAGKSAVIDAISFLLQDSKLSVHDRTYTGTTDAGELERVSEVTVEGKFSLRAEEQVELGLPEAVEIRRVWRESGVTLEIKQELPEDPDLRDLEAQNKQVLEFRLESRGLDKSGLKAALIERLQGLIPASSKVIEWASAPQPVRRALPRVERFDATATQNPEDVILASLKASYRGHLEDDSIKGDVATITRKLEERITADVEDLREHIKQKCSDLSDVIIQPSIVLDGGLKSTEVTARNQRGEAVPLSHSGSGRARRVALAVWEHNARILSESGLDTVILYDEPDTHLDYKHQRGFMNILAAQSSIPTVRIVAATHSMNLIDGVDIDQVVHLEHENSRTRVKSLIDDSDVGQHLGAIAESLGLRNTVLLHERLFVGVEGETESRALPLLFKLATGRHIASSGVAIWPCNNNDGALRFAGYLMSQKKNVLLVVDTDSLGQKPFKPASLAANNIEAEKHLRLLGERELEDLFSDAQWTECANRAWPRIDGSQWTEDQFHAHRGSKFSSGIEKMLAEQNESKPGKPEMMVELAWGLRSREEIPEPLLDLFDEFLSLAD